MALSRATIREAKASVREWDRDVADAVSSGNRMAHIIEAILKDLGEDFNR